MGLWKAIKRTFGKKKEDKYELTWRRMGVILGTLVAASFVFEFMRLYQEETARKSAVLMQGMPPECTPEDMTMWQSAKATWHYTFSWDHRPCEKYQRALMVDALWEVTPVMVVTSATTRCIINPVEQVVDSLGRCFSLFFTHIPIIWQPILVILITVLSVVFALIKSGYTISIPFVFSIGPSQVAQSNGKQTKTVYVVDKTNKTKQKSISKRIKHWFVGENVEKTEKKVVEKTDKKGAKAIDVK